MTSDDPVGLRRDGETFLSYGALGAFAFWLYAFGPALALLRSQLHFSYALVGGYSALWAAGAAGAGVTFAVLSRRLGRRRLLWTSGLTTSAGGAMFALSGMMVLSLIGATLMGFAGATLQNVTQSVLSDRHGPRREQALVESNIGAGVCAVIAPLALGGLATTPAGWQTAMAVPAAAIAALYFAYHREALPSPGGGPRAVSATRRLPIPVWLLALLVAVGVAVEFCVIYFGAELLSIDGLSPTTAATAMSVFYVGILAGRVAGSRLLRRPGHAEGLLWASFAVTTAGIAAFWLLTSVGAALGGLFVAGVGIANLFPVSLALALAAAPEQTDSANGAVQLLCGLVVIAAPLALGGLADSLGLRDAFTTEPLLIALSASLLAVSLKALKGSRRSEAPPPRAARRVADGPRRG